MSKIFITSDHHFFHNNIIKYCKRPYDWHKPMTIDMIKKWNEVVSVDDVVIHLGDITAALSGQNRKGKLKEIVDQLNGTKYLLLGNHDHMQKSDYEEIGFKFVSEYLIKEINGKRILFNHYPIKLDEYSKKPQRLAAKFATENDVEYCVHGHTHTGSITRHPKHYNVCVDLHGFYPVELTNIIKELDI